MDNITCVVDTCSFIYMQIPTIAESSKVKNSPVAKDKTLFDLFKESAYINIKISKEVFNEIKDPRKKNITKYNSQYATLFQKSIYKFKKDSEHNYHAGIFNNNLYCYDKYDNLITSDLGEKVNLAAAIDLFINEGKRNLVFLSDDFKAQNKADIISEISSAFKMCLYWDTFDAIFYLYLTNKKNRKYSISAEQTISFIDDIFSHKVNEAYRLVNDKFTLIIQQERDERQKQKIKNRRNKELASVQNTFNSQKADVLKRFEILKRI